MLLTDDFAREYQETQSGLVNEDCPILIIVGPDVDAICTAHMLKELLVFDQIAYKIVYISNYNDLRRNIEEGDINIEAYKVVVAVNWGGTIDLVEALFPDDDEDESEDNPHLDSMRFWVLDSHRPVHLSNALDDRIIVFGDTEESIPEDLFDDEEDDDEGENGAKKAKMNDVIADRTKEIMRREAQRKYYESSSFAISSAILVSRMITNLGKNNIRFMWWAAIGLTDQYLCDKIGSDKYTENVQAIHTELMSMGEVDEITLSVTKEPRFFLLRHWSIYESMMHSRYILSRIPIWSESGKELVMNLYARMGVGIHTCKEKYSAVSEDHKALFFDRLDQLKDAYGLSDVFSLSISFKREHQLPIAASDLVYAVNGVLNHAFDSSIDMRFEMATDILSMDPEHDEFFDQGVEWAKEQEAAVIGQVKQVFLSSDETKQQSRCNLLEVKSESKRFFFEHRLLLRLAHVLADVRRYMISPGDVMKGISRSSGADVDDDDNDGRGDPSSSSSSRGLLAKRYPTRQQIVTVDNPDTNFTTVVGVWSPRKTDFDAGMAPPNRFSSLMMDTATDQALNLSDEEVEFLFFEPNALVIKTGEDVSALFLVKLKNAAAKAFKSASVTQN